MALHIQMNESAEWEWRRKDRLNKIASAAACLLMIAGGLGILFLSVVFIVEDTPVAMIGYVEPQEERISPRSVNHRVFSNSSSSAAAVEPTQVSVITTTTNSISELAAVDVDMTEGLSLDASVGLSLGLSADVGGGWGESGKGLGEQQSGGSALEGTLYDLKQTGKGRSRKVSPLAVKDGETLRINRNKYYEVLSNFLNKGWSVSQLAKYYESPHKLYASCFYMPVARARYAPIAFQVGDAAKLEQQWVVQPAGWCVVYRGKVRAPKTGKFRFIGTGDDYIGVRFNRQVVLEGGYRMVSAYDPKLPNGGSKVMLSQKDGREAFFKDVKAGRDNEHKGYELINTVEGTGIWGQELGGLLAGKEFSVKEGETYPIEILVAEEGGAFGFALFIEDTTEGKNSKAKKYDLFRTNFATPSAAEVHKLLQEADSVHGGYRIDIPYNEDSLIWTVVP